MEKKSIIAIAIAILVLILWQEFYLKKKYAKNQAQHQASQTVPLKEERVLDNPPEEKQVVSSESFIETKDKNTQQEGITIAISQL